jgi:fumarate hydratase class I
MPRTIIKENDLIHSIEDALQFISYYHPVDFIKAVYQAYLKEESQAAKDAMKQILINSRMCFLGKRPVCQDTGIIVVFIDIGMDVTIGSNKNIEEIINEGVRRAYTNKDNPLRASIVDDPAGIRKNTKDNTPAVIHSRLVAGNKIDIKIAAKGGGSENKSNMEMLNPSDSIVDWVLKTVPKMGGGWCPPGILGIGIGGTAEKAALLAKESLMDSIDIDELRGKKNLNTIEKLRLEIMDGVNKLGIGAQGLGGLTTVLDIKIKDYPTHAASLPVVMIPNCAATRHTHFTLDGSGPVYQKPPKLEDYPIIEDSTVSSSVKKINVDSVTKEELNRLQPGDVVLLSGTIFTGRDAAHKRMLEILDSGKQLPVDLKGKLIYYVGPVNPVKNEAVGPAGPTTATRMDKYTARILSETGILGMIGKAERGDEAIEAIKKHKSIYFIAIGGAAYLVSKAIKKAEIVAFEDLGMEAIYKFEIEDMPVTVAVNSEGKSIHKIGPDIWKKNIAEKQVLTIK